MHENLLQCRAPSAECPAPSAQCSRRSPQQPRPEHETEAESPSGEMRSAVWRDDVVDRYAHWDIVRRSGREPPRVGARPDEIDAAADLERRPQPHDVARLATDQELAEEPGGFLIAVARIEEARADPWPHEHRRHMIHGG